MKLCILYTCGLVHCPVCVSHIVHSKNVTGSVSQVETAYTDCQHMTKAIVQLGQGLNKRSRTYTTDCHLFRHRFFLEITLLDKLIHTVWTLVPWFYRISTCSLNEFLLLDFFHNVHIFAVFELCHAFCDYSDLTW